MPGQYSEEAFDFSEALSHEAMYEPIRIPTIKPDGTVKHREVWAPDEATRDVHRHFLGQLYQREIDMPYAYGAIPGRSTADNISQHADNWNFFMLDVHDAFPSVDLVKLTGITAPYFPENIPGELYDFFLSYYTVTKDNGLILGPPSSPYLFNVYCKDLDERLGEVSDDYGLTYTRFVDDLTFSAPEQDGPIGKHKRAKIRDAIIDYGFGISDRKSKVHSLGEGPVTITGLSLYPSGFWRISPKLIERVNGAFDAVEAKLDDEEDPPTLHDLGLVDGYHSVIVSSRDPDRSGLTRIEQSLQDRYSELKSRLGAIGLTHAR